MKVIVTGAAGFIGGQTVLRLLEAGHTVYAIDWAIPSELLLNSGAKWLTGDFSGEVSLDSIVLFSPDVIVHCAGTNLVGPSVMDPQEYYDNNFVKTKRLLDSLIQHKINARVIFSSSAATYGEPVITPIDESFPELPISPYGESKLMIDMMLKSYYRACSLDYVSFRYFNACGADPNRRHGQAPGATHLIARFLEATRDKGTFKIYGVDYPTSDGTCVRDYVHVDDIARAHVLAIYHNVPAGIYNLGSNQGTSVKQVVERAIAIVGQRPEIQFGAARAGDPPVLTASADKFNLLAGAWRHHSLDDMIQHAWAWYNR